MFFSFHNALLYTKCSLTFLCYFLILFLFTFTFLLSSFPLSISQQSILFASFLSSYSPPTFLFYFFLFSFFFPSFSPSISLSLLLHFFLNIFCSLSYLTFPFTFFFPSFNPFIITSFLSLYPPRTFLCCFFIYFLSHCQSFLVS